MADTGNLTPEQILRAFRQLLAERSKLPRVVTREQVAERGRDDEAVSLASALTVESIVKGMADLQLAFDGTAEGLADTLVSEAAKLAQVRRAIEFEQSHLEELGHVEIAANALDILVQEKTAEAVAYEEHSTRQRETFNQEVTAQRAAWGRERQEHERAVAEYEASMQKKRSLDEADFAYDLERKRRLEADKFEVEKRKKELAIVEAEADREQQWSERQEAIASHQEEFEAYRAQVEAYPQELEKAVEKARDAAFQAATDEARVKTALFKEGAKANQSVRELNIQVLERTIAAQAEQIETLSAELAQAMAQAQALASKAIGGEGTRS